jgi:TP901 family phage tail tape measure protein
MSYDIGTAKGVIEMEYNGRGVDQAEADLQGLEKSAGSTAFGMQDASKTMARGGIAIAAALGAGVVVAASFEKRMSAIEAVSGATADEMSRLEQKALDLGRTTAFSAGESAQAMEELIKAGLSVDDVLNGAADATVALAAAGEVDMPTAATIASNAMNQFNLAAKDMVGVADSIAGAANASAIDVNEFGQSLSQVGAVANLAGLSFDDTATAIALLGNAGIKGSDAGTSLKTMLNNLQPTTTKQKELFNELGLAVGKSGNAFYDAQGNLKSMSEIAGVLSTATEDLSRKERQMALETLFGSDAIRAAAVIAENGAKGFDKMGESMSKVSAAEVAKTRMDNFAGALEEAKGSLETLGITVGSILLPALTQVVNKITQLLNWFLQLDSGTQKWIVAIMAGVAALLLIGAGIIKFILLLGRIQATLTILRGTMIATWLAALGPIALIIAAIAAVVAIIVILWNKSETFRGIVIAVWNAIKAATIAVWGAIKGFLVGAWNAIRAALVAAWNAMRGATAAAWAAIRGAVSAAIGAVRGIVSAGMAAIRSVMSSVWNAVRDGTQAAWDGIKNAVSSAIDWVMDKVSGLKDSIIGFFAGAGGWLVDAGQAIIQGLIDGIGSMAGAAKDKVSDIVGGIKGLLPGSPVKEGPLTVLNRGYAGKEIVRMLIDGIEAQRTDLADAMSMTVAPAAAFATAPPGSTGKPRGKRGGGATRRERLIDGELRLDPSGRAFISGVAIDADDDGDDYDDLLGRMN